MNWLEIGHWFLDLIWLGVLLGLLIHFWRKRLFLIEAQTWLQVTGRLTSCEWTNLGHSVWPKVEYSYEVYGQPLKGNYLFLDTIHNNPNSIYSRRVAYQIALAFKNQEDIVVYYNPSHPEQAALDVTIPKKINVIILILSALLALHLGMLIMSRVLV